MKKLHALAILVVLMFSLGTLKAQHDGHAAPEHPTQATPEHHEDGAQATPHSASGDVHAAAEASHGAEEHGKKGYDPTPAVMHHISDANQFQIIGPYYMPLPCILYSFDNGLSSFMSSKFENGAKAIDGYVLVHDDVLRIKGGLAGEVALSEVQDPHAHGHGINYVGHETNPETKVESKYVIVNGEKKELEAASSLIGFTGFIDFSITKNVFGMLLVFALLFLVMNRVGAFYRNHKNTAPTGFAALVEPVVVFLRDEVVKPALGHKTEKYMPYLLSLFFFILFSNLLGIIPFFPGSTNITGSIAVTAALAITVFLVVNLSANKDYWGHILWMPGVPVFVKILLMPIELAGIFVKPFTLLIRLFANITAGHIIILSLISLMFVFGNAGESVSGSIAGGILGGALVFVINFIELMVAFLQAYIFTMLAALYIGSAVEDHHHDGTDFDHGY